MKNKKLQAFTLAEILVTLGIIGLVAAMTIPSLRETTDVSGNVALLKKAYAAASNAFAQHEGIYGTPLYWNDLETPEKKDGWKANKNRIFSSDGSSKSVSLIFKSKMNVSKEKVTQNVTLLNGTAVDNRTGAGPYENNKVKFTNTSSFRTADGMNWYFSSPIAGCSQQVGDKYVCATMAVDVNGDKAPNRVGADVFFFDITLDGVVPNATDDCNNMSGNGYGCSGKVLAGDDHAIDFVYE